MEKRTDDSGDQESFARRIADRVAGPVDAFQIMTEADEEKADAALESLLDADSAEDLVLHETARAARPLADPDRFGSAHRAVVRAYRTSGTPSETPECHRGTPAAGSSRSPRCSLSSAG
ncbi:hypothetical protein GA707_08680 [Nostocoides sp. F2B08]|uniref:hypothetical protein n=1 Tax=Nostocoides sp. F2B08 TaxID=2653936 RepID=UPI0012635D2A|nr:hypothetical protein [Tetrasphaera sp. F2B08]KAB7744659.1 hypothetical protein GA707_08680 [Tetrasphaera sp. F2B08]